MSKRKGVLSRSSEANVVSDGRDLFVVLDGVKIAKRGQPGSKWAAQWISLEPGYSVIDSRDGSEMVIQHRSNKRRAVRRAKSSV